MADPFRETRYKNENLLPAVIDGRRTHLVVRFWSPEVSAPAAESVGETLIEAAGRRVQGQQRWRVVNLLLWLQQAREGQRDLRDVGVVQRVSGTGISSLPGVDARVLVERASAAAPAAADGAPLLHVSKPSIRHYL